MRDHEQTHEQSIAANRLTAKLIENGATDFDIGIAQNVRGLVQEVAKHRGVSKKEAAMVVAGYTYAA